MVRRQLVTTLPKMGKGKYGNFWIQDGLFWSFSVFHSYTAIPWNSAAINIPQTLSRSSLRWSVFFFVSLLVILLLFRERKQKNTLPLCWFIRILSLVLFFPLLSLISISLFLLIFCCFEGRVVFYVFFSFFIPGSNFLPLRYVLCLTPC